MDQDEEFLQDEDDIGDDEGKPNNARGAVINNQSPLKRQKAQSKRFRGSAS